MDNHDIAPLPEGCRGYQNLRRCHYSVTVSEKKYVSYLVLKRIATEQNNSLMTGEENKKKLHD